MSAADRRWTTAIHAAALLAVDPAGLGGATLRSRAGPARDAWLAAVREMLGDVGDVGDVPWRRLPPGVDGGRLLGGLDLAATLGAGRPVADKGLLAEAAGGVLVVPMAERLGAAAGPLAAALDLGEVVIERDGIAARVAARFACILLDEGIEDEHAPAALRERLAFHLDLDGVRAAAGADLAADVAAARVRLPTVVVDDAAIEALAAAGLAFGVPSLRLASLALRAAKAAAALAGRSRVAAEDVELAAALVVAPRATILPAAPEDTQAPEEQDPTDEAPQQPSNGDDQAEATVSSDVHDLTDLVVEAARAAIPVDLLAALSHAGGAPNRAPAPADGAGASRQSAKRGRPAGVRRGVPGHGRRLAIVDTLRAAAPWQPLRRAAFPASPPGRILVRRDDFRVARYKQKSETLTLFVVDASGSAALHRLAEVKGAVELILADCYVRRDQVALIAFRGAGAELILPPTRALVRAKRALAGQAGGGGTPLAAGVELAAQVVDAARRRGQTPLAVFLTDGKANIGRAGRPGRAEAESDALAAARALRGGGAASLVLDIAPRPGEAAARLAAAMGARYIPLPYADAHALSLAVTTAAASRTSNV